MLLGLVAVLLAQIEQRDRIVTAYCRAILVHTAAVFAVEERLASGASVQGQTGVQASRSLIELLDSAEKISKEFQDEYVSTEHLLLAVARSTGEGAELLARFGATPDGLLQQLRPAVEPRSGAGG